MTADHHFRSRAELFMFDSAGIELEEVNEWFANEPQQLFALARRWFTVFRDCGPDVNELIHDGCPTACVNGAAFGYVNVFKAHINVGFYTGAFLEDRAQLLEGSGKRMRHVKLRPAESTNADALHQLIQAAYLDVKNLL